jgi:hypothetical protein
MGFDDRSDRRHDHDCINRRKPPCFDDSRMDRDMDMDHRHMDRDDRHMDRDDMHMDRSDMRMRRRRHRVIFIGFPRRF